MFIEPFAETPAETPARQPHINRPPNAWVLYRAVKSKEYIQANPDKKQTLPEVSRIVSKLWARESPEVKLHFAHLAEEKKKELLRLHPNYRYQPGLKSLGKKKARTAKEGGVTKSRSKKVKTVMTSAEGLTHIQPTNVQPEANGLVPAFNNVVGLNSMGAPNDQHLVPNNNHAVYDNTIFSTDAFNNLFNNGAQPMAYNGQPHAGPSYVAMQPFGTSQANAYQMTPELGVQVPKWYTHVYNNQVHVGGGPLQPLDVSGVNNAQYVQMTGLDVTAGPSETYATAPSHSDIVHLPSNITHVNATGEHLLDATVNPVETPDSGAVYNSSSFLAGPPTQSYCSDSDGLYYSSATGDNPWVQV